jgi:DNA-3-methyladenine glycosylase I
MRPDGKMRCAWIDDDERMLRYHDREWGVPLHDDRKWFEFLVLDVFQAGLSWRIVLHKRENLRLVFHNFEPRRVAAMTEAEIRAASRDPGIIRNKMKIRASVKNAKMFLRIQKAYGSFARYIWSFTDGKVIRNTWKTLRQIPATTPLSDRLSKDLKSRGFSFVGSTVCYAILQSGGIVNDHLVKCFRHTKLRH